MPRAPHTHVHADEGEYRRVHKSMVGQTRYKAWDTEEAQHLPFCADASTNRLSLCIAGAVDVEKQILTRDTVTTPWLSEQAIAFPKRPRSNPMG